MSQIGGWDVIEALWIVEGTFGTNPSSGVFKHFGLRPKLFDPDYKPQLVSRGGIGTQIGGSLDLVKKSAQCTVENKLVAEDAGNDYRWTQMLAYALQAAADPNTCNDATTIASMSIGAKLDLATDYYWNLNGSKINTFELSCRLDDVWTQKLDLLCQKSDYGQNDYVTGSCTRGTLPNTAPLLMGDATIQYNSVDVMPYLNDITLRIRRNLKAKGTDATTKTLYRNFEEGELMLEVDLDRDFTSHSEMADFIASTARTFTISLDGRLVTLSGGKITSLKVPKRELDLLNQRINIKFTDIQITDV